MYKDFSIVIPTLNEEENIKVLISKIAKSFKGAEIIIVDDGSSDRTKEMVKASAQRYRGVRLIDRSLKKQKRGLTASVIEGFMNSRRRFVIVIDADLQHPPERIKEIAMRLESGKDLVVAVRESVVGWSLYRKVISKGLMKIGEFTLLVENKSTCSDIFSGFFGIDRKLFVNVLRKNKRRFVGDGYKVLFDFLKCIEKDSLKIAEVPYRFNPREKGKSKAGLGQGIALLRSFLT